MEEEEEIKTKTESEDATGIKLRPLTKYEEDMMLRARIKHKQNITHEQKCWGKTFQGSAFIPKPEKILFEDFEVGQTYTQTVILTNVSFTFNSFKLLPLDPEIKDFFNIVFTPPGRMSAGLTCPIQITFTPQINSDIISVFPILSETGRIDIPLECLSKKSVISVQSNIIDFGQVILGEHCNRTLVIKNEGALGSEFSLLDKDGEAIPVVADQTMLVTQESSISQSQILESSPTYEEVNPESLFSMLKFPRSGKVDGYSTTTIPFKFSPADIGVYEDTIMIVFKNKKTSPIILTVRGECIDVPIYVEQEVYDFKVCVLNHTYREKIVLRNRSVNPMKIQLTFPKDAKEHFEFSPTLGYIQGSDKFDIWVKFRPDNNAYTMLAAFQEAPNAFNIPIKVTGANQVMPVPFSIHVELTSDLITVEPPLLDFGDVYVQTAVSMKFIMKSHSALPQEYAFVRLPQTISIQPFDGFGTLLPFEELQMTAIYRPAPVKAGTELGKDANDFYIRAKTGDLTAREFKVSYSAKLQSCPIAFSAYKIDFPGLPVGEMSEYMISVTNSSRKLPYAIEIIPPPIDVAGLKITPTVIPRLATGDMGRILIRFDSDFRDLQKREDAEEWNLEKELYNIGGKVYDFYVDEPAKRSQHYEWLIPVYFRPLLPDGVTRLHYLQMKTVVINKTLIADPEVLDFGEIAVSCRKVAEFTLLNQDTQPVSLSMDPLPPFGGFTVLNAMRVVESGQKKAIVVEFEPINQQYFEEKLTIRTGNSAVSIVLKGRGVRPELKLDPEDGLLNMGNAIPGDFVEKAFTLKNIVSFPFEFMLKKRMVGVQNYNSLVNFTFIPQYGRIEPGSSLQVKVKFNPDHSSERYYEHILIDVPNQIDPKEIYLAGSCWRRSMYVKYDKPFRWPSSQELIEEEKEGALNFLQKSADKPPRFVLTFVKDAPGLSQELQEQTRQRKIVVGNCKLNNSKNDKAGSFEILMPKVDNNLFTCDVVKGNTPPGAEQKITFTFNPPPPDPLLNELVVLRGIGQWVEILVEGRILGGFLPPGIPESSPFEVLLRGYVQQI
ncbi:unnamed protein product [Blepharisma stoltei]|uniref:Uncharacterized protein n=1 Tax=Blepharisma stoltei TaxID=1481888 RepID=A0AAU9JQH1_9CILI|nr:unnamed protein product [Blepharisma stoltei]